MKKRWKLKDVYVSKRQTSWNDVKMEIDFVENNVEERKGRREEGRE